MLQSKALIQDRLSNGYPDLDVSLPMHPNLG